MSLAPRQTPLLDTYYRTYLQCEDAARFVAAVSSHYTLATLHRLLASGSRITRRGAALAIGFLGDFTANAALGRALHDRDRAVRLIAEQAIQELWFRDGTIEQRDLLRSVLRWNESHQFQRAARHAGRLIWSDQSLSEAWNQRAIAFFRLARYNEAIRDCRQALKLNPFHFGAVVGMGHCYLELTDGMAALDCFRRALRVNPNMENVRAQVNYLERALEGR